MWTREQVESVIAIGPNDIPRSDLKSHAFDAVLFDLCREDDYVGIFMEIQHRLMNKAVPL